MKPPIVQPDSTTAGIEFDADTVFAVQNVSKKFCRNLKRSMQYGMQDLARNLLSVRPAAADAGAQAQGDTPADQAPGLRKDEFWAVRNINFTLRRGETLGLIGDNGSGKSTLLRLLTGIFPPDYGEIKACGRVGALIALGAGFHPHMTGRENIYLNGTILGMKREEIDSKFDDIVKFSELGDFLEAPVTTYSSGMHARLGFSIAAHIHPDVLLVDEVLSVGDMAFQVKCRQFMVNFVESGGVVVFVSHNLNAVQSLCRRVIWLDHGRCLQNGPTVEVLGAYQDRLDQRLMDASLADLRKRNASTGDVRIEKAVLRNVRGEATNEFVPGEAMKVEVFYETSRPIRRPYLWVAICIQNTALFSANMMFDGFRPEYLTGKGMIACVFPRLPLLPSAYTVMVGLRAEDGSTMLIASRTLGAFRVVGAGRDIGLVSEIAESMTRDAPPVLVPYEWHLPDGRMHVETFKGRLG